tara:strand:- start:1308 stop:1892 length:585 start_codon:yes stop_codon:yes gene_type:complete
MSLEKTLRNMKVTELKKEISKTNVRGYSKLKKEDIINLMLKYPKRFMYLVDKPEVKKPEVKEPEVKEPNKNDEKEFTKNFLLKYNELQKKQDSDKLYSFTTKGKGNKGFLVINELEQLTTPKFLSSLEKVAGKEGVKNTIVNANNYKNQIIKSLYLDSIEDRGIYKKILRTTNKFIYNIKHLLFLKKKEERRKK